jgi:hypothetical protein
VALSNTPAREVAAPISPASTLEPECWLGPARCVIELDLDGDRRADRVETVREVPCAPAASEEDEEVEEDIPDPPCNQGLRITLATGVAQQVGAGVELSAQPASESDDNIEPIPLEADLGGLQLLDISHKDRPGRIRWKRATGPAPCVADGLVLTGTDAAAVLCWVGDTAAAYHLGF